MALSEPVVITSGVQKSWIKTQDDTGLGENNGKEEAAIRNKISAF
jgi:hypothetical protein